MPALTEEQCVRLVRWCGNEALVATRTAESRAAVSGTIEAGFQALSTALKIVEAEVDESVNASEHTREEAMVLWPPRNDELRAYAAHCETEGEMCNDAATTALAAGTHLGMTVAEGDRARGAAFLMTRDYINRYLAKYAPSG